MLQLNLISANLKNDIKLRHIYSLIKKISYILIIITIATAIILLAAKLILQNNFNNIVAQTTLVTKNNQGYNIKVREINNKLNYITNIQNNYIAWSFLIENLSQITPTDVSFYLTKINLKDKTIKIKGRAGLRASLLALKQNMENSIFFQEIDFPIKNILEKTDIDFEINAKLNAGNLIN